MIRRSVMALSKMLARKASSCPASLALSRQLTKCQHLTPSSLLPGCEAIPLKASFVFCGHDFPSLGQLVNRQASLHRAVGDRLVATSFRKRNFHCKSAIAQAGAPVNESRAESAARRDARKHPLDKEDISTQTGSSARLRPDVTVIPKGADLFFSPSATSWATVGLDPTLAEALQGAGFLRPSRVQEAAIPKILEGR
jgi:hypothetical protein